MIKNFEVLKNWILENSKNADNYDFSDESVYEEVLFNSYCANSNDRVSYELAGHQTNFGYVQSFDYRVIHVYNGQEVSRELIDFDSEDYDPELYRIDFEF